MVLALSSFASSVGLGYARGVMIVIKKKLTYLTFNLDKKNF